MARYVENQSILRYIRQSESDRAYPAEPLLSNAYSAVFGKPSIIYPGYQLSYLPNPNLRWEKVEAWEAGFETNVLRNRLHFEGVYYKKRTKDLLAEVPGISGQVPGHRQLGRNRKTWVLKWAASWRDRSVTGDTLSAPT